MLHLNNGSDYGPLGTNAFMKPHLSLKFLLAPKNLSKFCTVIWENTYNTYIYLWNRDKILKSCLTLIKTAGAHLLNQIVFNTCTIFPTIPCSSKKKSIRVTKMCLQTDKVIPIYMHPPLNLICRGIISNIVCSHKLPVGLV